MQPGGLMPAEALTATFGEASPRQKGGQEAGAMRSADVIVACVDPGYDRNPDAPGDP
jgi:hypothetical protein